MDKIVYDQDGITVTEQEVLDAMMPSPISAPPLQDGETAKDQFNKLFETMKLALIVRKVKMKTEQAYKGE